MNAQSNKLIKALNKQFLNESKSFILNMICDNKEIEVPIPYTANWRSQENIITMIVIFRMSNYKKTKKEEDIDCEIAWNYSSKIESDDVNYTFNYQLLDCMGVLELLDLSDALKNFILFNLDLFKESKFKYLDLLKVCQDSHV